MSMAEMWFGTAQRSENFISLLLGTGVGTGIILNGSLLRGATNSAGEFGHMTIAADGRLCRCGSLGCLETYLGASGIIQTIQETQADSPLLQITPQRSLIRRHDLHHRQQLRERRHCTRGVRG